MKRCSVCFVEMKFAYVAMPIIEVLECGLLCSFFVISLDMSTVNTASTFHPRGDGSPGNAEEWLIFLW